MEIDRIEKGKGKNKSEGKNKGNEGKGSGWSSGAWGFGRGRGGGRDGRGKGKKGRGKGKGNNKGKSKNKGKGPNKGKVGQDQCAICQGYGHWSRECPHRMDVNQVQETYVALPQPSTLPSYPGQVLQPPAPVHSAATTASASSQRLPSSLTGSTVRRIFHIGPPSPSSSPSSSTLHSSSVRMIKELDELSDSQWVNVVGPTHGDDGSYGDETAEWIILDSGSDVSLLPTRFVADEGSESQHALRDCQGGALTVHGTRYTDLQVQDLSGEDVILRHQFVVGDATTSLLLWDSYINLVGDYTKFKALNNYVWWIPAGVWKFQCTIVVSLLHLRLT